MRLLVLMLAGLALGGVACASGGSSDAPHFGDDASVETSSGCDPAHDTCPSSQHCSAATHTCAPGCHADDGCPEAKPHCDVAHNTCVVCLTADQCPSGQACSDMTCVPSCSASNPCAGSATCCNGACVDVQSSPENCGKCGSACALQHASATCKSGSCSIGDCVDGFADCDHVVATGCEASIGSDASNCGACGTVCGGAHATPSCVASKCALSCNAGFGDCDGNAANGCEADLAHDPKNCGACGASPAEVCNGKDDNCNGAVDETFACVKGTPSKSCSTSCGSTGVQSCSDTCTLSACVPPAESCNLVDDDCNGRCDDLSGCRVGVNRSVNGTTGEHFYTTDPSEAVCCGFTLESSNYYWLYTSNAGGALQQFFRCIQADGKHFYTTASNCEGQTVEGAMGWIASSATCGATPLYRLYKAANGDHFYTTDPAERDSAISGSGYILESTIGYVWTAAGG